MAAWYLDHGAVLLSSTPGQTKGTQTFGYWLDSKTEIKTLNDDDP
jgi:hypothetical protein